jgi:hypothetical protein
MFPNVKRELNGNWTPAKESQKLKFATDVRKWKEFFRANIYHRQVEVIHRDSKRSSLSDSAGFCWKSTLDKWSQSDVV